MALVLPILNNDSRFKHPFEILDQHFDLELDFSDLLSTIKCSENRKAANSKSALGSTTRNNDKFKVNLNVQQFKPDEIAVKVTGKDTITVECKHEEKQDECGYISRQITRRYVVPDGHDISRVMSSLSSDGVLTITAPRIGETSTKERTITIQQTGVPTKLIENQKQCDEGSQKKDQIF